MNLNTKRLILTEVSWHDLPDIHRLHSIPEVDEFNTLGIPENEEETREIIRPMIENQTLAPRKLFLWKILEQNSKEFIGVAGMSLSNDRFRLGEIFYKLMPSHWGKGYATEAAKAMVKAGFEKLNLHKVEAGVATGNFRSIRVLEKVGMTREGLRRKILPIRGQWKDNYHYAIVEDDPREY